MCSRDSDPSQYDAPVAQPLSAEEEQALRMDLTSPYGNAPFVVARLLATLDAERLAALPCGFKWESGSRCLASPTHPVHVGGWWGRETPHEYEPFERRKAERRAGVGFPAEGLRAAVDALPWLDVTLEDGETGGQMIAKHAVLDLIDARLQSEAPAPDTSRGRMTDHGSGMVSFDAPDPAPENWMGDEGHVSMVDDGRHIYPSEAARTQRIAAEAHAEGYAAGLLEGSSSPAGHADLAAAVREYLNTHPCRLGPHGTCKAADLLRAMLP